MSSRIVIKDRGWAALLTMIKDTHGGGVTVGVLETAGPELVEIAVYNEFGTETIPQRSFIREGADAIEPKLAPKRTKLARAVIAGKLQYRASLELLGALVQGLLQERIANRIKPPNAESTIARKGSDVPLIDHGTLRSHITYRVDLNK